MKLLSALFGIALAAGAQELKLAVIGLEHSHVWGHLGNMLKGEHARLVAIAEPNPDLVSAARKDIEKAGKNVASYGDYHKMLDEQKPDFVWSFVDNSRHAEIVRVCAPRKIHVIFEKPLAAAYQQALEIQQLAKKHGIQVMSNYQMAW